MVLRAHPALLAIAFFTGGLVALAVSGCTRPRFVETPEPPLADPAAGPFRPRPRPEPPAPLPDPAPEPTDERDRVLFGRVRTWAENAAERRAAETVRTMVPTDAEVDAAIDDELNNRPPRTMGSPGAWLAVVLTKVASRIVKALISALLLAALVALLRANWHWIVAAFGVMTGVVALLSRAMAWLFGRRA